MKSQTGSGLLAVGFILAAVGAVLAFAVSYTHTGFSIHDVGIILLIVGIIAALSSLVLIFGGGHQSSVMREDIRNVPGGTSRTVEQDDRAI